LGIVIKNLKIMTHEEIIEEINFKLLCIELVNFQIDLNSMSFSELTKTTKDAQIQRKLEYENNKMQLLNDIEDLKELDTYLDFIRNGTNFDNV
jgi:hypothetical protein